MVYQEGAPRYSVTRYTPILLKTYVTCRRTVRAKIWLKPSLPLSGPLPQRLRHVTGYWSPWVELC